MAIPLSQTLIRRTTASHRRISSPAARNLTRRISTQPENPNSFFELTAAEVEAKTVEKIEDVIHGIIVKRSKPDWLPLVPGASYWVPPRRSSYGVADIVQKFTNALTEEEYMSLVCLQGWPSAAFYINNEAYAHSDLAGDEMPSSITLSFQEEQG